MLGNVVHSRSGLQPLTQYVLMEDVNGMFRPTQWFLMKKDAARVLNDVITNYKKNGSTRRIPFITTQIRLIEK